MKLTLFVAENCSSCERVKKQLVEIIKDSGDVSLVIENVNNCKIRNIVIVPALYVNNELYSYGDINRENLSNLIKAGG